MLVKDLRKALAKMPGEMMVYLKDGEGVARAQHIFKGNLIGMEQSCVLTTYFQEPETDMLDSKIERETGFKDRNELIEAYKKLKDAA